MTKNNDKTQRDYLGIKTACLAMLALLFLLACVLLQGDGGEILGGGDAAAGAGGHGFYYENLALMPGVEVTADSVENDSFLPQLAADGKKNAGAGRWSSANEAGAPEHWLQFSFPQEQSFAFVSLYWERLNVLGFVIEISRDGEHWTQAALWEGTPETNEQHVVLDNQAQGRFLRLRTTAVSDTEENQYLYYQNVSLLEMEVYAQAPVSWCLQVPEIRTAEDGRRFLPLPEAPAGYEIRLLGSDYEEIIDEDGTVYPTLEEKTVTVGYRILQGDKYEDSPSYYVTVPPSVFTDNPESPADNSEASVDNSEAFVVNDRPRLSPEVSEWKGGAGFFPPEDAKRIVMQAGREAELRQPALDLQESWKKLSGEELTVVSGEEASLQTGDIYLGFAGKEMGLKEEGYWLDIRPGTMVLRAEKLQGLIWATVTAAELLENAGEGIPCGTIRDYPRYSVRGFHIDIGRRMVSLETLKQIVLTLSEHKMNNLGVHLNDNEILSTSGKNDSISNAFTAYAGFRLESGLKNSRGEGITSQDGSLTREEWKELTRFAAEKGVQMIPEIDTPAHSLALTRIFPEYALADEPDNVDQLDLDKKGTVDLVQKLWKEYLEGEDPVFEAGGLVHIGMDEYFADGEDYRSFANDMISMIQESGRTVRMWGSLSRLPGRTQVVSENVQMQIWNMEWADPQDMYGEGFTIINSLNSSLYIIPGGGYDRLDLEALKQWEPNLFAAGTQAEMLPAYSGRMAGAVYCLWNDTIGSLDTGVTEEGILERFLEPLPLLSGKLW